MNTKRRTEIQLRWNAIDAELEDIRNGKVTKGSDPATREGELLEEIDELEFEVGEEYLRKWDGNLLERSLSRQPGRRRRRVACPTERDCYESYA